MSRLKFIVLTLVMAAMLTGCYNSTSTKKKCVCVRRRGFRKSRHLE